MMFGALLAAVATDGVSGRGDGHADVIVQVVACPVRPDEVGQECVAGGPGTSADRDPRDAAEADRVPGSGPPDPVARTADQHADPFAQIGGAGVRCR